MSSTTAVSCANLMTVVFCSAVKSHQHVKQKAEDTSLWWARIDYSGKRWCCGFLLSVIRLLRRPLYSYIGFCTLQESAVCVWVSYDCVRGGAKTQEEQSHICVLVLKMGEGQVCTFEMASSVDLFFLWVYKIAAPSHWPFLQYIFADIKRLVW